MSVSLYQGCYFCSTTYTLLGFISAFMPGCCGCSYIDLDCRNHTVSVCQCKAFWPITCWIILGCVSRVWLVKLTLFCSPSTHPLICFSLFHSLEMKNIRVKKSQWFHYFIPISLSLRNPVQAWIITTPVWSLLFRKCNLVLVLRISSTMPSYSSHS